MSDIDRWFDSGAEVQEGLRLLNIYAPNPHLRKLVELDPKRFAALLKQCLSRFRSAVGPRSDDARTAVAIAAPASRFRDEWPFLSRADCPPELKILAADKITAWQESVDGHEELFQCVTPEQCFETAKNVLENFSNNRKIFSEFSFYKEHHSLLGEHPIFRETQRMNTLRALPILELVQKKKNLEGAIWRANDEIKKGTKPHLREDREARIAEKRRLLDEVNRMIKDYEDRQRKSS